MGSMLVHPWDAPNHDDEWRAVLREFDFGALIAPGGPHRDLPVVVPTHFIFDGEQTLELHLARPNPVWQALAERPRALFTVVADYVYVPAAVNADAGDDPALGVPTSYYAAVQAEVDVEIVDDPVAKAEILARQLRHFEPPDSVRITPSVDVESDLRLMPGIRGLRLTITGVRAKFKFGGNKTQEHRADIAAALEDRDGPMDASARRRLMTRLLEPTDEASAKTQR
jgi:transcriptional regulator